MLKNFCYLFDWDRRNAFKNLRNYPLFLTLKLLSTPSLSKSFFWFVPHLAKVGEKHSWRSPLYPLCLQISIQDSSSRLPLSFYFYRLLEEMVTTSVWPPLSSKPSQIFENISPIFPIFVNHSTSCHSHFQSSSHPERYFSQVSKHTQRLVQDHSICNGWNLDLNLRCLTSNPVHFALCLKMFWLTN